jgi:hypothetical protein
MADPRKGTGHLLEALRQLDLTDLLPVCVGHGSDQLLNQLPDLVSLGYLSDPYRQALVYSAADLFVAPSLEEAFGQVFIEAAACGLPSVAYPVGGVPEALLDGISGRLAAAVSPEALAKTIFELYRQPKLRRDLGVWGSLYVQTHFSLESSYFTLSFALREALASRGIQLASNICFPAPAPVPCAPLINLAPPPSLPLEQQMEEYFQKQLEAYRLQPLAWFFKPQAWLARMSRNAVRKARRD